MTNNDDRITAYYRPRNEFLDALDASIKTARDNNTPPAPRDPALIRCMTAMRDLARYIADAAQSELDNPYPDFYCAFLDDDSDYMPAALDMMNDLMLALTYDDPDHAARILIDRITRDEHSITAPDARYSEFALDAACDLPIRDTLDD